LEEKRGDASQTSRAIKIDNQSGEIAGKKRRAKMKKDEKDLLAGIVAEKLQGYD